jgi:murein DD-endopeptidase MepM/ murein hydrolase activator NlpD
MILLLLTAILMFVSCTDKEAELALKLERERVVADSLRVVDSLRVEAAKPKYTHGEILPNQGLFQALEAIGVDIPNALKIANKLKYEVELDNLRAGEKIKVLFGPDSQTVIDFVYEPDKIYTHRMVLDSAGEFQYSLFEKPTELRYKLIEGELAEGNSLDYTLRQLGIPQNMVGTINGVLLCKISFNTDARKGDKFSVLLREKVFEDSVVIESKVMHTAYRGVRTGFHEAFRYDDGDPKSSYTAHYTRNGEALVHSGLRYPVDRLHITSGYGYRIHPITGRRAFHNGVDYGVPTGAPVYAVAPGVVMESSYSDYGGNTLAIRHSDNSSSWYLHLSTKAVKKGSSVRSRQIIGRAGATGRVTGPHLHFGFKGPNGAWMNPLQKRMIATPKLSGERYDKLLAQISDIEAILTKKGYQSYSSPI